MSKAPKLRFKEFSGDWETYLLGKSITLYDNERKPVKEQERKSGEYAYYGATGIIDYIDDYIFEGEYLLLGEDGANIVTRNAPLIYKTEGKFWVNNHAHIFKPKSKFDIDFMKQKLELINYIPYNTGTAQPKLNADSIKSIPFNAPKLEEQEKIASFFSLIDDKISLQEQKVEALKDYKNGMMQKIFSRELRFKDDEGRDYPEWEEKKLGDIAYITMGQSPSSSCYNEEYIGLPLIQGNADVKDRKTSPRLYTSEITKICEIGDIIMSVRAPVGAISMSLHNACIGRGVCSIKPKYSSEYIYQFLLKYESKWSQVSQGSTFESVNSNDIKSLKIPFPNLDEQNKIGGFLRTIDNKIEKEQEKLDSLNEYKKGLLQQMFI